MFIANSVIHYHHDGVDIPNTISEGYNIDDNRYYDKHEPNVDTRLRSRKREREEDLNRMPRYFKTQPERAYSKNSINNSNDSEDEHPLHNINYDELKAKFPRREYPNMNVKINGAGTFSDQTPTTS